MFNVFPDFIFAEETNNFTPIYYFWGWGLRAVFLFFIFYFSTTHLFFFWSNVNSVVLLLFRCCGFRRFMKRPSTVRHAEHLLPPGMGSRGSRSYHLGYDNCFPAQFFSCKLRPCIILHCQKGHVIIDIYRKVFSTAQFFHAHCTPALPDECMWASVACSFCLGLPRDEVQWFPRSNPFRPKRRSHIWVTVLFSFDLKFSNLCQP